MSNISKKLRRRAKTMNGARLVGGGDGGTYALGYFDQFCAKDCVEAADEIDRLKEQIKENIAYCKRTGLNASVANEHLHIEKATHTLAILSIRSLKEKP